MTVDLIKIKIFPLGFVCVCVCVIFSFCGGQHIVTWYFLMGLIACLKMSVTEYQAMLHNIQEEWRSHLCCSRSLTSQCQDLLTSTFFFLVFSILLFFFFTGVLPHPYASTHRFCICRHVTVCGHCHQSHCHFITKLRHVYKCDACVWSEENIFQRLL